MLLQKSKLGKCIGLGLLFASLQVSAHNQSHATIALTVKTATAPILQANPSVKEVEDGVPKKFWSGDSKKLKVKLEQSTVEVTPVALKDESGKVVGIEGWFEYQETPHAVAVDPIQKRVVGVAKAGTKIEESEWASLGFLKAVGQALLKAY